MSDRRDNRFNRKETSIHVPPYCISVVRHVKSVVHRHSTLSPRVIAKVPPRRVPAFSRSTTWVFRASWKMVLLVIPYAHHIWHYSCIRLNKFVPLVPDVGLFAKNTEGRFTVSLIVLTKAINSQGRLTCKLSLPCRYIFLQTGEENTQPNRVILYNAKFFCLINNKMYESQRGELIVES